jgi:hypothetical protein
MVERLTVDEEVVGSTPIRHPKGLSKKALLGFFVFIRSSWFFEARQLVGIAAFHSFDDSMEITSIKPGG